LVLVGSNGRGMSMKKLEGSYCVCDGPLVSSHI
jgi:hypothetical protein